MKPRLLFHLVFVFFNYEFMVAIKCMFITKRQMVLPEQLKVTSKFGPVCGCKFNVNWMHDINISAVGTIQNLTYPISVNISEKKQSIEIIVCKVLNFLT